MPDRRRVPIRTCLICGRKSPKRDLLRIVRRPNRSVEIDALHRLEGRGCYLCPGEGKSKLIELEGKIKRALKLETDVPTDFLHQLAKRLDPE